jgi:hypothetical protein
MKFKKNLTLRTRELLRGIKGFRKIWEGLR